MKHSHHYYCHFADLEFIELPKKVLAFPVKVEFWILKIAYFLKKIKLERMTGNVVISEVDAIMYVILSRAEKHVPYVELVGTTEHITL